VSYKFEAIVESMREWKTVPSPTPKLVRAIRVCHRRDALRRDRRRTNFIAAV
jgi:hypothetical protein